MKIYKTQAEVKKDIVDDTLFIKEDVEFKFNFNMAVFLKIKGNITAMDITAMDISARNITARNISFYGVCFAYEKFFCRKIKGERKNSRYFCLDTGMKIKSEVKK